MEQLILINVWGTESEMYGIRVAEMCSGRVVDIKWDKNIEEVVKYCSNIDKERVKESLNRFIRVENEVNGSFIALDIRDRLGKRAGIRYLNGKLEYIRNIKNIENDSLVKYIDEQGIHTTEAGKLIKENKILKVSMKGLEYLDVYMGLDDTEKDYKVECDDKGEITNLGTLIGYKNTVEINKPVSRVLGNRLTKLRAINGDGIEIKRDSLKVEDNVSNVLKINMCKIRGIHGIQINRAKTVEIVGVEIERECEEGLVVDKAKNVGIKDGILKGEIRISNVDGKVIAKMIEIDGKGVLGSGSCGNEYVRGSNIKVGGNGSYEVLGKKNQIDCVRIEDGGEMRIEGAEEIVMADVGVRGNGRVVLESSKGVKITNCKVSENGVVDIIAPIVILNEIKVSDGVKVRVKAKRLICDIEVERLIQDGVLDINVGKVTVEKEQVAS